jgi:CRISPR/Cas system-associated exonuclease Cas4 (RecB family)
MNTNTNTHNQPRVKRTRDLNFNNTISSIFGKWDRTVCFSEIRKYHKCPAQYLMSKEGDAKYKRSLTQEIGDLLHAETAKPLEERLQDTAEIAARLHNVPRAERMVVAAKVKEMIARAVQANDIESLDAAFTEHEILMVFHDPYTNTTWYAKPDKMDLIREADGRSFLNVVDQKTGKHRSRMDKIGAFFFAFVARETKAMNFTGPVKAVVRYLKDRDGYLLPTPFETSEWIGRRLNRGQEDALQGIQETVRRMDMDWQSGEFEVRTGGHCNGCPFRHTCPANAERWTEQLARETERLLGDQAEKPAIGAAFQPHNGPDQEQVRLADLVAIAAQTSPQAQMSAQ